MLLVTILVAKSRSVRLIMSSSPYMYLFRILHYSVLCWVIVIELLLCYSVLCWVIVIELLLCFCCVLYNLNSRVLLCEIKSLP